MPCSRSAHAALGSPFCRALACVVHCGDVLRRRTIRYKYVHMGVEAVSSKACGSREGAGYSTTAYPYASSTVQVESPALCAQRSVDCRQRHAVATLAPRSLPNAKGRAEALSRAAGLVCLGSFVWVCLFVCLFVCGSQLYDLSADPTEQTALDTTSFATTVSTMQARPCTH